MPHRNAPLTETGRLRLARCVVQDGWPVRRAAERFQVSPATAARWAARYRELGPAGMADRSCRPHHSPNRTPTRTERRIIGLRVSQRLGPAITHNRTRPYRPQTNGKVERYHRTLADEWAYARPYATETQRRATLPDWLHAYNNHRGHTALKGQAPASRVTNLSGHYT